MNHPLNLSPMAAALGRIAARLPDIFVPRSRAADKRELLRQYRALDQQIRRYVPAPPERLPLIVVYDQPGPDREPARGRRGQVPPQRGLALAVYSACGRYPTLVELNVGSSYVEDVLAEFGIEQALVCGMTRLDGAPLCFLGLFHRHHIDHLVLLRAGAPDFLPGSVDSSSSTLPALHGIVRLAGPDRLQLLEVFAPPNKVASELSPALVQWLHSTEGRAAPYFRGPALRKGESGLAILN